MKNVALFKTKIDNDGIDPYVEILMNEGYKATVVPTLAFSFINEKLLISHLTQPDEFEGIIFSSLRAVEALKNIYSSLSDDLLLQWKMKKNYCVGEATANLLSTLLSMDSIGKESGNAEQLCSLISSLNSSLNCKSFLYPSSSKRRDTIPTVMQKNGFKVIEVVSYETICNPLLKSEWEKLISEHDLPNILVFFSPSGVQYSHELIKTSYSQSVFPKCIAIGPSTAEAMIDANMPPCQVASKPSPQYVYEAVKCL